MSTAADLYSLQEIDLAIDLRKRRLEEIASLLEEPESLLAARLTHQNALGLLVDLRRQQKDLDIETSQIQAKAAEIEKKLYGGTVRSPKELQDLQEDMLAVRRQAAAREEILLSVMLEAEEAERQNSESAALLAAGEQRWQVECAELLAERTHLETELAALGDKRIGSAGVVAREALQLYDALRARRQGVAVARVERGMCQGCRISLPVSALSKARSGASLVQCVSCERILYMS